MREASALGKEWYEQSDGYASYLKGKTAEEIEKIPSDGSDADSGLDVHHQHSQDAESSSAGPGYHSEIARAAQRVK